MEKAFTAILNPEDMGHILEIAEQWIRDSFCLWELSGTELPSQHLTVSKFLLKREINSILLKSLLFFIFLLFTVEILVCHISVKSGNRKDGITYLYFSRKIHLHSYLCVTCEHLSLLPLLLPLFSSWTLDC